MTDLTYDYLIVGGGSAGCVLANRLSADGRHRVCLVEAGPDDRNPLIHVPFGVAALVRGMFVNWKYWSEPQAQLGGRPTYQPRGKTLGGSSAINGMVCTRGHRWDYDHWSSLGCAGWSYDEVLPYFRRSECYTAPLRGEDEPFHGHDGPLHVGDRLYTNPISEAFVEAGQQAGYRYNDDFNGTEQEGVGPYRVFQVNGRRCSNAVAYLDAQVRARPNLTILTDTQVTGIVFDGMRAIGLQAHSAVGPFELHAQREVVLAAGAFQSPQLLLLSGIGPTAELQRHGIAVRHELQGVGRNLQDHLDVIIEVKARGRQSGSRPPLDAWRSLVDLLQFLFRGNGPLTSNVVEVGAFLRSSEDESIPDLQLHFAPVPNIHHGMDLRPLFQRHGYMAYVNDMRPKSRGEVGLKSADPLAPPRIDPNYLSDPADLLKLVTGVRKAREILAQAALVPHHELELSPGPEVQSDEQIADWVRAHAETIYHPVGTCRMGTDETAVVDPQLRVHGLEALRVVDASIMPTLVGSNTNAPTTMIAEKAADLILAAAQ